MVIQELHKHNDTWYKILRKMSAHNFTDSTNRVNMDILKGYRDYIGGDHVLSFQNEFWICETIQDAEILEEYGG